MSYFWVCLTCGSHLDPGETCTDCQNKEEAAPSAANTEDGRVEKGLESSDSASIVH